MHLIDLTGFVENNLDKKIVNEMIKESENTLNKRIGDMICTSVGAFNLSRETKIMIKFTIEGHSADSFGGVATLLFLIPYLEITYEGHKDIVEISNNFIKIFVKYCAKDIGKGEFVQRLWSIQEAVGISNKLGDGLVDYFGSQKEAILKLILQRLSQY